MWGYKHSLDECIQGTQYSAWGEGSSQKSDTDLGQTLALPLISCVNLSKPRSSLPQFPQVQNGDN